MTFWHLCWRAFYVVKSIFIREPNCKRAKVRRRTTLAIITKENNIFRVVIVLASFRMAAREYLKRLFYISDAQINIPENIGKWKMPINITKWQNLKGCIEHMTKKEQYRNSKRIHLMCASNNFWPVENKIDWRKEIVKHTPQTKLMTTIKQLKSIELQNCCCGY